MRLARFDLSVCVRTSASLSSHRLYFSWQVVLHRGHARVPVNAAVEESRRDGPGRGECQPVADWLMCQVRGYQ